MSFIHQLVFSIVFLFFLLIESISDLFSFYVANLYADTSLFIKIKKQIPKRIKNVDPEYGLILLLTPLKQSLLKRINIRNWGTNFTESAFGVRNNNIKIPLLICEKC